MPTSRYERAARKAGYQVIAGLDEAGRGALFGPVFAAAVVLDPDRPIRGLDDSKALLPERRATLAGRIRERALGWGVGSADVYEIDRINIYQASLVAMKRAFDEMSSKLTAACDYLLLDAVKLDVPVAQKPLIHGDALSFSIAAASILAKTRRDTALLEWDRVFPQYGFATNKGYSTPDHLAALEQFGPTMLHRFSFEPVRASFGKGRASYQPWTGYPVERPDSPQGELFACR